LDTFKQDVELLKLTDLLIRIYDFLIKNEEKYNQLTDNEKQQVMDSMDRIETKIYHRFGLPDTSISQSFQIGHPNPNPNILKRKLEYAQTLLDIYHSEKKRKIVSQPPFELQQNQPLNLDEQEHDSTKKTISKPKRTSKRKSQILTFRKKRKSQQNTKKIYLMKLKQEYN